MTCELTVDAVARALQLPLGIANHATRPPVIVPVRGHDKQPVDVPLPDDVRVRVRVLVRLRAVHRKRL